MKIEALIERREDTHARHEDAAVQRIRSQASAYPLSLSYPPIFPRTQFTKTIRLTRGPREYLAPLSLKHEHAGKLPRPLHPEPFVPVPSSSDEPLSNSPILSCHCGPTNHPSPTPAGTCLHHPRPSSLALGSPGDHVGSSRPSLPTCLPACEKVPGDRFQTWRARICCGGRRSSTPPSLIPPKVPAFYQEDAHTELAPGSADQMWHLLPLPS